MSKPKEKQTVDEQIKNLGGYTEAELRELIEAWKQLYEIHAGCDSEYEQGLSEGARSAALELERLIEDE